MLGIAIILAVSIGLLRLADHKVSDVLGIRPTRSRLMIFLNGLWLSAVICGLYHMLSLAFVENSWMLNPGFTLKQTVESLWWVFKSVLFEELIFRGVLLYFAVRKLGVMKASLLSAVCFGVYHWFSYNTFGQPVQMLIVFFMTGLFGFALAYAFAKTRSFYLPLALHLGWNMVHIIVFSAGPIGPQVLVKLNTVRPEGLLSLCIFLFQVLVLPLMSIGYSYFQGRKISGVYNRFR